MVEGETVTERVKTGIEGLDSMLYGGIPQRSQILLIGDAGSGKTLMAFEIAYKNASAGIQTTYITLEENKKALIDFAVTTFSGFPDAIKLILNKKINIEEKRINYPIKTPENLQTAIADIIKTTEKNNSKLLIIDSFSLLRALYTDDRSFTRGINYIVENIRNQNVTSIMTFESSEKILEKTPGLFEESMFDGIIRLGKNTPDSELPFLITIVKMRYSRFKRTTNPFTITPQGIVIGTKK
jgi:circadian clock protein KaiC